MAKEQAGSNNLIVVSDLHCGCRLGLCPPKGIKLVGGTGIIPSKLQLKMYKMWQLFWSQWVPMVTKNERYDLCLNGDITDNVHHNSTSQISHNMHDQCNIAREILEPVVARVFKLGGRVFIVKGTGVHDGESGKDADDLATSLGATIYKSGETASNELWIRIGDALVHCMHTVGTTASTAHESSAVCSELTSEFVEAARWNKEPPQFVVRSHRHRFIAVDIDCYKGYAAGLVTPGWQLKTPFTFKIAGARVSQPQFGGICIRQGDEEAYYRRKTWCIERPDEE